MNLKKFISLSIAGLALLLNAPRSEALMKKVLIRGELHYNNGAKKKFFWSLRLYVNTGIVLGSSLDKDGYAEFFGIYKPRTKRLYVIKNYKRRRKGRKKFYYRGKIVGKVLVGTAHLRSFWGPRYADWSGIMRLSKYKFTLGKPKKLILQGKLIYLRSRDKKDFIWSLRYYPSSGRCFGSVVDRDGRARFEGVYDKITRRFYLVKKYGPRRVFYYRGYLSKRLKTIVGTARKYSFIDRKIYGVWKAKFLISQ